MKVNFTPSNCVFIGFKERSESGLTNSLCILLPSFSSICLTFVVVQIIISQILLHYPTYCLGYLFCINSCIQISVCVIDISRDEVFQSLSFGSSVVTETKTNCFILNSYIFFLLLSSILLYWSCQLLKKCIFFYHCNSIGSPSQPLSISVGSFFLPLLSYFLFFFSILFLFLL